MIHPQSKVTWMDLTEGGKVYTDTIDAIFEKHAINVHQIGKDVSVIAFGAENGPKIKIQDWTGWTNVMTIWKHMSIGERWITISAIGLPEWFVNVSEYELVPFYDPDDSKQGFHGEVKYAYRLKHPEKRLSTDHMRVRGGEDFFKDNPQFTKVHIEPMVDDGTSHGYQIYTLSTFMSANGFHLYASDEVDVNLLIEKGCGYK